MIARQDELLQLSFRRQTVFCRSVCWRANQYRLVLACNYFSASPTIMDSALKTANTHVSFIATSIELRPDQLTESGLPRMIPDNIHVAGAGCVLQRKPIPTPSQTSACRRNRFARIGVESSVALVIYGLATSPIIIDTPSTNTAKPNSSSGTMSSSVVPSPL